MFKEIKYFLLLNLFPPLVYLLLSALKVTLRIREVNREAPESVWAKGESMIACFWHGRLLAMPLMERKRKARVLISRHRDGEFITRVIGFFGLGAIRASYRKATVSAMREILSTLRQGVDIAVTPDGPKGPGYTIKKGIIELAKLSGNPILPVTYSARKKKFSIPGTGFSFPTLLPGFSSSGVSPSTFLLTPQMPR